MGKSHVHSIQRGNSDGQHTQEKMSASHVVVNANQILFHIQMTGKFKD